MKISALEDTASQWHQYIPIQSLRQSFSIVAGYFLVVLFLIWLVKGLGGSGPWGSIYFGAAIGIFPTLLLALPQKFTVEASSSNTAQALVGKIDDLLQFRGFRNVGINSNSQVRYVSKLPYLLCWKENEFFVLRNEAVIYINGPRSSIGWLRKRLAYSK